MKNFIRNVRYVNSMMYGKRDRKKIEMMEKHPYSNAKASFT